MQHTRCSPGERASACDLASDVEFMLFQFEFRTHLSRCENRNISVRLHKSLFLSQLMATFAFIYPLSIQFSTPPATVASNDLFQAREKITFVATLTFLNGDGLKIEIV